MIEELRNAGLTDAEARTYLALLRLGGTSAGPLIHEAEMHRATVYDALKRLQEKGLVSSVLVGKVRRFQPVKPDSLLRWQQEKVQKLNNLMPQLMEHYSAGEAKQEVRVFQGKRGIRTVMEEILDELNPNGEYLDFGVSGNFKEVMGPFWNIWQKLKTEREIKSRCIFSSRLRKDKQFFKDYQGEYRFHPKEYESPTDTMIYSDKVAMFIWTGRPPIAIVIRNKENAEGYRKQFELMWMQAEK